jgi:hypothetical protein
MRGSAQQQGRALFATKARHHRSSRAVLAAASANIAFNCDLVSSLGCLTTGLRVDTTLWIGRAQAANSAGFRFGTDTILGLAVGGLWPRFKPTRSNLAQTALRLCPSRVAICAALWPLAQSFLRSATLAASHMGESPYTQQAKNRNIWSVVTDVARGARMANIVRLRWHGTKTFYVVGIDKAIESVKALRGFEQNCYAALKNLHHCEVIFGRMHHHLLFLPLGQ